jgi:soluble lytic murein transglycosylase-like protein
MRSRNAAARTLLFVMVTALAGASVSRASVTVDDVALSLKDSIALIGTDDRAAAAALRDLAASDTARPLRDVSLYFLARAQRQTAPRDARSHLEEILKSFPRSPLAARAACELLELDGKMASSAAILPLLDRFTGDDVPSADAARLALIVGERLVGADRQQASRALQRARRLGKGSRAARDAAEQLRKLRATHTELVPQDAQGIYEEAKLAAAEGDVGAQTEWLDRFIAEFPSSTRFVDALLLRARVIARTEGRPAAAAWLESRANSGSNTFRASLLHAAANHRWNADDDDRALADFERVIALKSGGRVTQESLYSTGRIHESHRRYTAAAAAYRRARDGVDATLAAESDWRAGWASYLAGNYTGAANSFGDTANRYRTRQPKSGRESALYWQGRSTERAGKSAEADAIYRKLLAEFPDGYYAYVTERRTDLAASAPKMDSLAPLPSATEDRETREKTLRISILKAAGLDDIADIETDRLVSPANLDHKRALLPELVRLGAHRSALQTALGLYYRNRLTESELYPFLYPRAYHLVVTRESAASGIDANLVFGLMKQESLFDPRAVSPALAYGLMQLLPSTARRVAGDPDLRGEDLFDPTLNIHLGIAYLAELSRRFDGEAVFVLAGYNAGETAADGWRARYGKLEIDELVERITYRETREYVKKVLANVRTYSRLYGSSRSGSAREQTEQPQR